MKDRISIGEIEVCRIIEREGPFGPITGLIPDAHEDLLRPHLDWLAPNYLDPESFWMFMSVHSYLIRTPRHTVLLDACAGNHKERPHSPVFHQKDTPYLDNLAAAGVSPEDIDIVMCTHLHVDHVGWNTRLKDGRWVPTFPNARYLFAKEELAYWESTGRFADGDEPFVYQDSVLPVVEAGMVTLVDQDHQIEDGLVLEGMAGHTPGHTGLWARGGGESALFTGDSFHHPCQIVHPEWSSGFCVDPAASTANRRRLLEVLADTDTLMLTAHFVTPTYGRIVSNARGFGFDPL